jgi:uncharacterized lipoprotein YddW (UPF0748 family)
MATGTYVFKISARVADHIPIVVCLRCTIRKNRLLIIALTSKTRRRASMYSTDSNSKMKRTLIVTAVIILSALLLCQALSLNQSITIPNSMYILGWQSWAAESQWRGALIGGWSDMPNANWTLMANTLASYGVNFVDMDVIRNYETAYQSVIVPGQIYPPLNFTQAINAFHAHGISVYAHFMTMMRAYGGDGTNRDAYYLPGNLTPVDYYGGAWLDIANPATPPLIKSLIHELVSNYSIDGIVFDYTRWDDFMPVGTYDFAQFKTDTGLDTGANYTTWISDIAGTSYGGNGKYNTQFSVWRTQLVDTFVKNITQWALAINPNLKFGATPHSIYPGNPDYWTVEQGQDAAYWISQGYIQFVMPMMYPASNSSSDVATFNSELPGRVQAWKTYTTGGAHGIVPLVGCITAGGAEFGYNYTVAQMAGWVSTLLANGADGWIINEYGGPGANPNSGDPDLRPYFAALNLTQTFALTNVIMQAFNSTSEQISWTTSSAANSTVEYNSSQLFVWSQVTTYDMLSSGFPYWQDKYLTGFVTSNATSVTNHTIILTGLTLGTKYYFRIQSGDLSGIATTSVMMFST